MDNHRFQLVTVTARLIMLKISAEYNLGKLYPKLAKEWHPTKNGKLTPYDILPKSGKKV
jgi:hypothetical protein